jgi:hypothetical protein
MLLSEILTELRKLNQEMAKGGEEGG